jgi:hypothetical protein
MDIKETGKKDVEWIFLAQVVVEVVSCCEHVNEPAGYVKCGEFLD